MSSQLRDEDRRAIDLLLDRAAVAAAKPAGASVFAATDELFQRRVTCTQKVLSLLDYLGADEPSRDLLNLTLRHVKEASGRDVMAGRHIEPSYGTQPPAA